MYIIDNIIIQCMGVSETRRPHGWRVWVCMWRWCEIREQATWGSIASPKCGVPAERRSSSTWGQGLWSLSSHLQTHPEKTDSDTTPGASHGAFNIFLSFYSSTWLCWVHFSTSNFSSAAAAHESKMSIMSLRAGIGSSPAPRPRRGISGRWGMDVNHGDTF